MQRLHRIVEGESDSRIDSFDRFQRHVVSYTKHQRREFRQKLFEAVDEVRVDLLAADDVSVDFERFDEILQPMQNLFTPKLVEHAAAVEVKQRKVADFSKGV